MRHRYYLNKLPLILMAFALLALVAGQPTPRDTATAFPDHVTLTWTGDPSTSITITWRTDFSVNRGLVQYQEGNVLSANARQKIADARDFITDLGPSRLFTVTLHGLSGNRKYSYRVGDGEYWSDVRSFTTADPQARSFKFLVFGDTQSSVSANDPYGAWRVTLRNAYRANPDARFMVIVGDLVDYGQRGDHWNAWFAAASGVIDSIPIMPVSGNHESYGSHDTTRPEYYVAQFALPQNGPEGLKGQVYSYDYGPVHFVVLDSQQEEQKKYGDILEVQRKWLDADLSASRAAWKIVFFHRPPYGILARRPNDEIKKAFCPILEKHRVDLVFNGHDHGIARTCPIRDGVCQGSPSEGTIYYVCGRSGEKSYPDVAKMPWNTFFYNAQDQPNYLVVEVQERSIVVSAIKQDGTLLDKLSIHKAGESNQDLPQVLEPAAAIDFLPFFVPVKSWRENVSGG